MLPVTGRLTQVDVGDKQCRLGWPVKCPVGHQPYVFCLALSGNLNLAPAATEQGGHCAGSVWRYGWRCGGRSSRCFRRFWHVFQVLRNSFRFCRRADASQSCTRSIVFVRGVFLVRIDLRRLPDGPDRLWRCPLLSGPDEPEWSGICSTSCNAPASRNMRVTRSASFSDDNR